MKIQSKGKKNRPLRHVQGLHWTVTFGYRVFLPSFFYRVFFLERRWNFDDHAPFRPSGGQRLMPGILRKNPNFFVFFLVSSRRPNTMAARILGKDVRDSWPGHEFWSVSFLFIRRESLESSLRGTRIRGMFTTNVNVEDSWPR